MNTLSKKISEGNVNGDALRYVDREDIESWGIKDFKAKKILYNHIKSLLNQNNNKINNNNNNNDNEGVNAAPTAYIG